MTSGYSGKSLESKLGVKPGLVVYVDKGPADLDLGGTSYTTRLPTSADVVLLFCADHKRLTERLETVLARTSRDGMVWVCWPKKASGVVTDLTEALVRETGLAAGVVDVKVAAIDETWSGLKFVRRLRDR